jgi:hypothetical protein
MQNLKAQLDELLLQEHRLGLATGKSGKELDAMVQVAVDVATFHAELTPVLAIRLLVRTAAGGVVDCAAELQRASRTALATGHTVETVLGTRAQLRLFRIPGEWGQGSDGG